MKQKERLFIVLGLHRSGSSATAGILHFLGADMGQNADLFENLDFVLINDEILWSNDRAWDNPPTDEPLITTPYLHDRMEQFLSMRNSPLWGLKDPRLLLTFDVWQPFFKKLKNVTYVFIHRPFLSSVQSLAFRDQLNVMQATKILSPYLENFYRWRYTLPHDGANIIDVHYNTLVNDAKS